MSPDGRCTKTGITDQKVSYFSIGPVPFPIDLDSQLVWNMHGVSTAPAAPIFPKRTLCGVVECWNDKIWSWFATINLCFVHAPTDDCCIRIGCVDGISDDAPTEYCPWSFDLWWNKRVGCPQRGCKIHWSYNPSTAFPNRAWFMHVAKFGRVSHLEMAPSAHLSPCGFYAVFGCIDLENSCDPTENIPNLFDRACNLVWYGADICVRMMIL